MEANPTGEGYGVWHVMSKAGFNYLPPDVAYLGGKKLPLTAS